MYHHLLPQSPRLELFVMEHVTESFVMSDEQLRFFSSFTSCAITSSENRRQFHCFSLKFHSTLSITPIKNYEVEVEVSNWQCLSSKDIQGKNLIFLDSENNDRCGVQVDTTSLFLFCMGAHKYRLLTAVLVYFIELFIHFTFGDHLSQC